MKGEQAVTQHCSRGLILRTSWVYSDRGSNFAKTIVRLAQLRDELSVVADQVAAPTGADLLADVTAHLVRGARAGADWRGLYHVVAAGETSWHKYASFVLANIHRRGVRLRAGPDAAIPIDTRNFPTPAMRPNNSRLDTSRLRQATGLALPHWQEGLVRMLAEAFPDGGTDDRA